MILQIGKKGSNNLILMESRVIESFSVGDLKSKLIDTKNCKDADEELYARKENYNRVENEIKKAGFCRDNITWYLGDPALEENDNLVVVTTDDESYVFSRIGCEDKVVFILNNSGKTISRVL